jgi:hypothetical protein
MLSVLSFTAMLNVVILNVVVPSVVARGLEREHLKPGEQWVEVSGTLFRELQTILIIFFAKL